jgi:hypothetical protein
MKNKMQLEDPFRGRFDAVKNALHNVLQQPFSGTVGEACNIGNAATTALRIIDGQYDISELSYKITQVPQE